MNSFHLNNVNKIKNNNIISDDIQKSIRIAPQNKPTKDEILYKTYYLIPPRQGRYIVLDTETTGLNDNSQIVELACHEIINGKLTGVQFHIYIRPRTIMDNEVIKIHKITNSFYDDYYKGIYEGDKQNLINFINFVGNSLIFAHNAPFDMNAINNELKFWKLNEISFKRFRCTMRIFTEVIGKIDSLYYDKFVNLEKCCEFFKLKCEKESYHNALFDSFMTARLIDKLYELIEGNQLLKKKIYIGQKSIDNYLRGNSSKIKSERKMNSKNINYLLNKMESKTIKDENRNKNPEVKSELTSSTGGENDDSSLEKMKEEKINKQLENGELSNEIIEQIFSEF
jgi:DNA polymerase III epsilon subunit family exonuclease